MKDGLHPTKLGYAFLAVTAALDTLIVLKGTPSNVDSTIVGVILGAWHGQLFNVGQFFFGSSSESNRKTELLAAATPASTPNVADTAQQVSP